MNQGRIKVITLMAMCCALFMANLNETAVNVALPKIQDSLDSDLSELQWILNAYMLPGASLVLISGTLGDIYGRKRVFEMGLILFTLGALVCSFVPNVSILIAGRILQGIGAAAMIPTSLSILADTFREPKERAKAIGLWSGISGLALVAGPLVGGLLVDLFGWQSVFFLNVPFGLLAFGVSSRVIKKDKPQKKPSIDYLGFILSMIWLIALNYALIEGNQGVWQSPFVILLLTIAGVSLLAFLIVESHSIHPMLPLQLFHNSTFAVVNVVKILLLFTLISFLFIFSLFLQDVQGYSAAETGLRFLPLNGVFVMTSISSGWFVARLGWRSTIAIGLILAGVAILPFVTIRADTEYTTILWNLVLSGFGCGLAIAPLTSAGMNSAPQAKAGIASAVLNTSAGLGNVLGIALQGTIFKQQLVSDLHHSLKAWNLPSNLQEQIIINALHKGALIIDLPASISPSALHQAINSAFVSGVQATVLMAGLALLAGAFLILTFIPQTLKQKDLR